MAFHITYLRRAAQTEETQDKRIEGTQIEIGRGAGCDIILDDLRVALRHAIIEQRGPVYILTDMPDTNGTYVNGEAIQTHQLADNDTIHIGSYTLRVRLPSPEEPLAIEVEYPEGGPLAGQAAQVVYRARYKLSSGFFTKSRLTIVGVLVVLGITALAFGSKSTKDGAWTFRTFLSPARVSQAHSVIEYACAQCHGTTWQPVADTTCKTCHDGPQHHSNQAFTAPCVTCHAEHRGRQAALKVVEDRLCTQCHAALQTQGVATGASRRVVGPDGLAIHSFTSGHPEFAVHVGSERVKLSDRDHLRDVTQMQLNHEKHLKPNLSRPDGVVETLTCSSCHQADAQGAYMRPITYEEHCMRCHLLEFDARFPRQTVPHGKQPEDMQKFLRDNFTQRCLERLVQPPSAPQEGQGEAVKPRRPGQPDPRAEAEVVVHCSDAEVRRVEQRLYTGGKSSVCGNCHTLQEPPPGGQLPTVIKPEIPVRWFTHSKFEHRAHIRATQTVSTAENKNPCEICHRPDLAASKSTQTTDVLLPGIALCQECHTSAGKVRSACVTCHAYHDRAELERGLPQSMEKRFMNRGAQLRNPPTPLY